MTIERKVGMGIAGQPTGPAADVAEVFSIDLFTVGNQQKRIYNDIDLTGEGGMVWFASRAEQKVPNITDTERGAGYRLRPFSDYNANGTAATSEVVTAFKGNGFIYGDAYNSSTAVAWTFRKKEKFFDVVTYSGDNTTGRSISHALDGPVGMIIVKKTSGTGNWHVLHRSVSLSGSPAEGALRLNTTGFANSYSSNFNATFPTDSVFYVSHLAGASSSTLNTTGETYVAYLFADNSSEDAKDQMIKCGSYTGNATFNGGPEINLGWEPQFVMIKCTSSTAGWFIYDSMRGVETGGQDSYIYANADAGENTTTGMNLQPTGFQITGNNVGENGNNQTYIYMAIRAPMMKEPEAATDVFAVSTGSTSATLISVGFPPDFIISKGHGSGETPVASTRLTNGDGKRYLRTDSNSAELVGGGGKIFEFDLGDNFRQSWGNDPSTTYMWKRAKGYMDAVCYSGSGSATTVPHNLGVPPEMIWAKRRSTSRDWNVYAAPLGNNKIRELNTAAAFITSSSWNNTNPTSTVFSVSGGSDNNRSGDTYIAYLFATLAGISKVGSFVGNGSSQTISCGFSAGSRYILIKRTDASGDWYVWDSVRGIVAGNDPHLSLNTTSAHVTNNDSIDPDNSGFIVNQVSASNINVSSGNYIFYAIA